ncbi:hypothetical protein [Nocardioides sp.]|nr:hypothetical protein [Nocardioides sp.]HSX66722.1 hypothetical protein [Nocardioides sp.]
MTDTLANHDHMELVWKREKGADGKKRLVAHWVRVRPSRNNAA